MYGVIFLSLSILALLGEATTIGSDGTFRSAPEFFHQVYTIHVDYQGHTFPFAYVLMTHRNQLLYEEVMNHILETVTLEYPNFNLSNIKYCMSDFEPAILGAMKVAFPNAVAKGCWVHYGQAIYRKTSELGLSVTYKQKGVVYKIVKELIALALLPAKDILEGFQVYYLILNYPNCSYAKKLFFVFRSSRQSMKLLLLMSRNALKMEFRLCMHTTGVTE